MTTTNGSADPDRAASLPATTADPGSTPQPPPMADPTRLTTRLRLILAVVLLADVLDLMDSTTREAATGRDSWL